MYCLYIDNQKKSSFLMHYTECLRFKSQPRQAVLSEIFHVFPQSFQAHAGIVLKLGYNYFILYPFQFISYHVIWLKNNPRYWKSLEPQINKMVALQRLATNHNAWFIHCTVDYEICVTFKILSTWLALDITHHLGYLLKPTTFWRLNLSQLSN